MSGPNAVFVVFIVVLIALGVLSFIGLLVEGSDHCIPRFIRTVGAAIPYPAPTEAAKAEREREKELDRRTAQIIRERGIPRHSASELAEKEYMKDMKQAGE